MDEVLWINCAKNTTKSLESKEKNYLLRDVIIFKIIICNFLECVNVNSTIIFKIKIKHACCERNN